MSRTITPELWEALHQPSTLDESGRIPDDAKVSARSCFGDGSWDFSIERNRPDQSRADSTFHWRDIPRPFKEYVYLRLWRPLPGQARISVPTALNTCYSLQLFWKWMKKTGITTLEELTQDDFDDYLRSMKSRHSPEEGEDGAGGTEDVVRGTVNGGLKPSTVVIRVTPLLSLPLFRGRGLTSSYTFVPWAGQTASEIAGWWASGENSTPTIPDDVYRPLMAAAIEDVRSFKLEEGAEIEGAAPFPKNDFGSCLSLEHEVRDGEHVTTVQVAPGPKPCGCDREPGLHKQLQKVVVDGVADGKPSRLVLKYCSWRCHGCHRIWTDNLDGLLATRVMSWNALAYVLKQAAAGRSYNQLCRELAVSYQNMAMAVRDWGQNNGTSGRSDFEITAFQQRVQRIITACYIVIIGLSGMRDGEAKSLKVGCCEAVTDPLGNIIHYRVRGRRLKQGQRVTFRSAKRENSVAAGTKMNYWVVVEEVARAIWVLEAIHKVLSPSDKDQFLFRRVHGHLTSRPQALVLKNEAMARRLRQYLQEVFAERGLPPPEWTLKAMQFRETLAAHIAEEPFGTIAGQLQYGHVSQATFQGYCNSDKFWNGTIEKYRERAKQQMADDIVADVAEGHAYGGGAKRLRQYLGVAGDRRPNDIAYMVNHVAKTLHVGQFNYCFFSPEAATCHQNARVQDRNSPVLTHCNPHICGNACVTRKHLPQWEAQIADARSVLKTRGISPNQKTALLHDIAGMDDVVDTVKEGKLNAV